MKTWTLRTELWLPRPIDEVFPFFADARNLERITPPWLQFKVLAERPVHMQVGTRIPYKLRVHGIPLRWESEITAWEPPCLFVDEQRRGPYRLWIHEHRFETKDGGTLAQDVVKYAVPGGAIVRNLFVKHDVDRIFQYRTQKLTHIFRETQNDEHDRVVPPGPANR